MDSMNVLLLMYIYVNKITKKDISSKFQKVVDDFVYDVKRLLTQTSSYYDFKTQLHCQMLELCPVCYRIRSKFLHFLNESESIWRGIS